MQTKKSLFVPILSGILLYALLFSVHSVHSSTPSCRVNASSAPNTDYPTIQAALDDPQCIDITVEPGVYRERLVITRSVDLRGASYASTIIDGESTGRVIDIISASVTISGVTIQNGFLTNCSDDNLDAGAGIRNQGILTLTNVWLQHNRATSCYHDTQMSGGAIQNNGQMLVIESTIFSNSAPSGGGVGNFGFLHMVSSSIAANQALDSASGAVGAGGLYNAVNATAFLTATGIISNEAYGLGGGICSGGVMTIATSQIADNRSSRSGGGLVARGRLTLSDSRIVNNHAETMGGGVLLQSLDVQNDLFQIQANEILSNTGGGLYASTLGGDGLVVSITSNLVRGNQGSAIELDFSTGAPSDVRFERNLVIGNQSDPNPTMRISGRRIGLFNNIIAYNRSSGISVGRLEDNNQMINNTIWQNQGSGISISGPLMGNLLIQNNIVGANQFIGIDAPGDGEKVAEAMYNNNIWGNSFFDYSGLENQTGANENLSINPMIVAPDAGNWRLLACSPMIDAGRSREAPDLDFFANLRPFGAQWDIGAVEFQGESVCLKSWLPLIQAP